jgi:protein phosphatase PTC6
MISDGVSSTLSDQEIVDIARHGSTPLNAASAIVSFAEELGTEDNASAIIIPLAGWGKIEGPDKTKDLRVYRQNQAVGSERQRRM